MCPVTSLHRSETGATGQLDAQRVDWAPRAIQATATSAGPSCSQVDFRPDAADGTSRRHPFFAGGAVAYPVEVQASGLPSA